MSSCDPTNTYKVVCTRSECDTIHVLGIIFSLIPLPVLASVAYRRRKSPTLSAAGVIIHGNLAALLVNLVQYTALLIDLSAPTFSFAYALYALYIIIVSGSWIAYSAYWL